MLLRSPSSCAVHRLRNPAAARRAFHVLDTDLSAKEALIHCPLVMGGIMFLQQHPSPQTRDPSQAAMMKWMPVIFTSCSDLPVGAGALLAGQQHLGRAQTMYLQKTTK